MPIWLRRFTFNQLKEHYDKQAESLNKSQGKSTKASPPKGPAVKSPTYSTKARK